ncbi:protein RICE SALT SENSITIVE 3 [Syzygium oleosum]|uniref:protein RICE SALT SENSITIVE 3 n=1 Tax=Syzygium oleosum TaxID=219896 RepID=UPI0024BAF2E1|nr:protein RICE SALT SENSITIVE 3 [Syzygium oleosum]
MEEHLNPLAATHLLQHTLRSLCLHENSQWVYAVFWRILPRNYPPPKWEAQGAYERSRGNRRNWIMVWEDGFCNFAASTAVESASGDYPSSSVYGDCEFPQYQGLQPELFFKMSHEIYNYGEGIIGKVAADYSHKWIHKEPNEQEINFLSAWHNSAESHPRTWEAQFQSGIKTIALIAVKEGVVQLGAVNKVVEDLSYVVLLRKRFSYIESIPGVLLPHPSSSSYPNVGYSGAPDGAWHFEANLQPPSDLCDPFNQPFKITPSMSSLEALLSKLPSVVPPPGSEYCHEQPLMQFMTPPLERPPVVLMAGLEKVEAKEEMEEDYGEGRSNVVGESSSSMSGYRHPVHTQQHYYQRQDVNSTSSASNNWF